MKKIICKEVSKTFIHLNTGKRVEVISDINIEISKNESIAILGSNGAGKTTLLRIICGALYPTTGSIQVHGRTSWPVGFGGGFDPHLTARDNIKFISNMMGYGFEQSHEIQSQIEKEAGLEGKLDYMVSSYSSGMKSRLFFYTSIMFDFDFYLFDEISAVGDRNFQGSSNTILNELSKEHGIVVVTHAVGRVSRYCDYGYVLDCGKISEKLPIDEAVALYENI